MRKSDIIGILLLAFVIGCRISTPLADFYAKSCYPAISACLSFIASIFPFSLEEIIAVGFIVAFFAVLVLSIRRKEGFLRWFGKTVRIAMWLVVWLYMGWGNNYFRTRLYPRMGIRRVSYEKETFSRFLSDYTASLDSVAGESVSWNKGTLETDIKEYYRSSLKAMGYAPLRSWQHVKKPLLNPLYSAVGVLGFMGPFACESQLNLDLLDYEYPFTLAHELAHLAGVTSEAEANYWAYSYCRRSPDLSVRYSGALSLLPYVASSAAGLLPEEDYSRWAASVPETAKQDYTASRDYWRGKRVKLFDEIQSWLMDTFLKSNSVAEGARDYYGVVGMIMTMDAWEKRY